MYIFNAAKNFFSISPSKNFFLTKRPSSGILKSILGKTLDPRLSGKISLTGVFYFRKLQSNFSVSKSFTDCTTLKFFVLHPSENCRCREACLFPDYAFARGRIFIPDSEISIFPSPKAKSVG